MSEENKSNLFFVCSLIEEIGRQLKQPRSMVVKLLGKRVIRQLLRDADILHCEPLPKVAEDYIEKYKLPVGSYDNVGAARYTVPDAWTIGKVYARLAEDIAEIAAFFVEHRTNAIIDEIQVHRAGKAPFA